MRNSKDKMPGMGKSGSMPVTDPKVKDPPDADGYDTGRKQDMRDRMAEKVGIPLTWEEVKAMDHPNRGEPSDGGAPGSLEKSQKGDDAQFVTGSPEEQERFYGKKK